MRRLLIILLVGVLFVSFGIAGSIDQITKTIFQGQPPPVIWQPTTTIDTVFIPSRSLPESLAVTKQWSKSWKTNSLNNSLQYAITKKTMPATVKISTRTNSNTAHAGSGFNIDPAGLIITNAHVVDDAWKITVTFPSARQYQATIQEIDLANDLAILKLRNRNANLPTITFGDSDYTGPGEAIMAFGYRDTFISITGGTVEQVRVNNIERFSLPLMQINAIVYQGNSGGPVMDSSGKAIGIITGHFYSLGEGSDSTSGAGAVIPVNAVKPLLKPQT